MPADLKTIMRAAASAPGPPDPQAFWERGRRRRRGRVALVGAACVVVAMALLTGLDLGRGHDRVSVQTNSPSTTAAPPSTIDTSGAGWTTVVDRDAGFTIDVPPGWAATDDNLVPQLTSPVEIFSAGTYPLERPVDSAQQEARCDPILPLAAVQGGPADVFATIQDARLGLGVFPPDATVTRQVDHVVGEGSFEFVPSRTDLSCAARQRPGTEARWIWFGSETRSFYLAVVIGPDASGETRKMLWLMLDSFRPL